MVSCVEELVSAPVMKLKQLSRQTPFKAEVDIVTVLCGGDVTPTTERGKGDSLWNKGERAVVCRGFKKTASLIIKEMSCRCESLEL